MQNNDKHKEKTAQHHKSHIPEPNDNIEFTCILHSVVIYIFKLEDSNVHDRHGELAVNETVIPSFSTKFTFALLSKMHSCGLIVMCKYTLTLTTNAKKKTSKKRSGKSKVINHSLDGWTIISKSSKFLFEIKIQDRQWSRYM